MNLDARSRPELLWSWPTGDFGALWLRVGDLTGNGIPDLLFVQNDRQMITCLTATTLQGEIIWQVGKPDVRFAYLGWDVAAQVYDYDQDGYNEILCVRDGELQLLSGQDGAVKRRTPVPLGQADEGIGLPTDAMPAMDAILIANFSGQPHPQDIVLKDRYTQVWAFNPDWSLAWTAMENPGHAPWAHDLDGDGRDELVCGYTLLDGDGKVRWRLPTEGHADAIAVGDLNDDGQDEIVIGNGGVTVVDRDGQMLWNRPLQEAQHVTVGWYRPDLPGMQVGVIDRGSPRNDTGIATAYLFDHTGHELWRLAYAPGSWAAIGSRCNWLGDEDSFLVYRRGPAGEPIMLDGHGNTVATFPMPYTYPVSSWTQEHLVIHADILGDDREEVIAFDERHVYIYTNAAARLNKLQYNYTHYIGMP